MVVVSGSSPGSAPLLSVPWISPPLQSFLLAFDPCPCCCVDSVWSGCFSASLSLGFAIVMEDSWRVPWPPTVRVVRYFFLWYMGSLPMVPSDFICPSLIFFGGASSQGFMAFRQWLLCIWCTNGWWVPWSPPTPLLHLSFSLEDVGDFLGCSLAWLGNFGGSCRFYDDIDRACPPTLGYFSDPWPWSSWYENWSFGHPYYTFDRSYYNTFSFPPI